MAMVSHEVVNRCIRKTARCRFPRFSCLSLIDGKAGEAPCQKAAPVIDKQITNRKHEKGGRHLITIAYILLEVWWSIYYIPVYMELLKLFEEHPRSIVGVRMPQ